MKKKINFKQVLPIIVALPALSVCAQGKIDDYNRAYKAQRLFSAKNVYYGNVKATWLNSAPAFWYVRNTPNGPRYVLVDAAAKKRQLLFDHADLAGKLKGLAGADISPDSIYLNGLRITGKGDTLRFSLSGKNWEYLPAKSTLIDKGMIKPRRAGEQRHWMVVDDEKGGGPVISPDGTKEAFIKNSNVYVRDTRSGKERQLSIDGTDGNYYSSWIKWSPDGKKVAACKIRPAQKRYV